MSTQVVGETRLVRATTRPAARFERPRSLLPLLLILALQLAEGALLLHNSAFQDEALYIYAGAQIWHSLTGGPPPPENYAVYFSGYPYVYPLLAGILNGIGGLEVVRWFSALCMLVPTGCAYAIGKRLYSQASGFAAAALFAFLGPTLLLSRLATFDALCLALIALAALLAIQVSEASEPAGAVMLAPLLVLAFGAKYAALIFVPLVIGLMAVRTLETRGWGRAALHVALALATLVGLVFTLYHTLNHDFLHAIQGSTTNRAPIATASSLALLSEILSLGGLLWLLGLVGLYFSGGRVRLTSLALVACSVAMPAYHLYSGESVSLQKHVGYGLFFIAPLAGYAVAEIVGRVGPVRLDARWLAALMIFTLGIVSGLSEANWWYQSWPNSSQLVTTMRTQVRPATGHYLCEDMEVVRYYLADVTTSPEYTGLGFFQYPGANGEQLTGQPAYVAAIQGGYFDLVELSEASPLDPALQAALAANPQYQLIARIPYTNSYGRSYYLVWRRNSA
ncbi:MAG TPA: glycosyltransferase family 39 protein [Ktedonobacterales bacterium]